MKDCTRSPHKLQQAFRRTNENGYTSSLEDRQVRYAIAHIVKHAFLHNLTNCPELEHPLLIVNTVTCNHHIKETKVTCNRLGNPVIRRRCKD